MEGGNENHCITKWYFYLTSMEVGKNCIYSTDSTNDNINRITVCERGNYMGNIHLSNVSYKYKV